MLHDLDNSLKKLLEHQLSSKFPDLQITFAPTAEKITDKATINLFLQHLVERKELKGQGEIIRKDTISKQIYQKPAPLWLDCYYQISCCVDDAVLVKEPFQGKSLDAQRAAHWLLTETFSSLTLNQVIPDKIGTVDILQGSFAGEPPVNQISATELFSQHTESVLANVTQLAIGYKLTIGLGIEAEQLMGIPIITTSLTTKYKTS